MRNTHLPRTFLQATICDASTRALSVFEVRVLRVAALRVAEELRKPIDRLEMTSASRWSLPLDPARIHVADVRTESLLFRLSLHLLSLAAHPSEEAHQSRTRAQVGRLELAISALESLQKGLERHRLRAELPSMKARHLQLKQAIESRRKASKKRAAMFSAREVPEPQVVVRREALATMRADVIVFQSGVERLTSLQKAENARKASSAQWMSTFARFTSELTDFAKSIHRWLENTRLASNVKQLVRSAQRNTSIFANGVISDDISVEDNNELGLDQIAQFFPESCQSKLDTMGSSPTRDSSGAIPVPTECRISNQHKERHL